MKKISVIGATLVGAAKLLATPVSLHQSRDTGLSLSVDKAQAVIGRPLTPGSVAGAVGRLMPVNRIVGKAVIGHVDLLTAGPLTTCPTLGGFPLRHEHRE